MADAIPLVVDKSALSRSRLRPVRERLRELDEANLFATCALVDLEVLYSARSLVDYEDVRLERAALIDAPITPAVMHRAIDVQHELARTGHHRLPVADLVIAAAAELSGFGVLHYDADFERIAATTGQTHEWVAPRGSL